MITKYFNKVFLEGMKHNFVQLMNHHNNNYERRRIEIKMIYFIITVFCYDHSFISVYIDNLFISIDNSSNNWLILEQRLSQN